MPRIDLVALRDFSPIRIAVLEFIISNEHSRARLVSFMGRPECTPDELLYCLGGYANTNSASNKQRNVIIPVEVAWHEFAAIVAGFL